MQNLVKHARRALLITLCSLYSALAIAVPFSPYVDMTLNTHWDNATNNLAPYDWLPVAKQTQLKRIHLAFITDAGVCQPAWGGQPSYSVNAKWGAGMIAGLRQQHIATTVSLGGASGQDLSAACTLPQLSKAYETIIATYQPDALDFDIENGTANVDAIMQALTVVQRSHPDLKLSFTLPVMPDGLTVMGDTIISQAHAANLTFTVNLMAMDYGPSYVSKSMGLYAIDAATGVFQYLKSLYPNESDAQIWGKIQVTPMIGVNDVAVEKFTLNDVDTLRTFAVQKGLAGLSMWSLNRDYPCADKWASPICSGDNLQHQPYEFTQRFTQ